MIETAALTDTLREETVTRRARRRLARKRAQAHALPRRVDSADIEALGPALARRLGLRPPFSAAEFARRYARFIWIRIHIISLPMGPTRIHASCIRRGRRTYIIQRRADGTTAQHSEWSTWHEIGHIVLGHLRLGDTTVLHDLVRRDTPEEIEAETFAEIMWLYARGAPAHTIPQPIDRDVRVFLRDLERR